MYSAVLCKYWAGMRSPGVAVHVYHLYFLSFYGIMMLVVVIT